MTTIADALAAARRQGLSRLDAQLLLAHSLNRPRTWLLAHDDDPLDEVCLTDFLAFCRRRAAGEPLAYLVGEREFHGLRLRVTPAVLVPRPDTETLVDWALDLLSGPLAGKAAPQVVDLGTGSGAIALAVGHECPRARVVALDASAAALEVARDNARSLGVSVEFVLSDWWSALAGRRFHLALANPPYIAGDDAHLAELQHEPLKALTPGGSGLGAIASILEHARDHLLPGGWMLLEHGHDQGDAVRARLHAIGLEDVQTRRDLENRERCSGGRTPLPASVATP
ncbi:MAG TPA: peptide chain release factor N(5)-glutamine methyltransferase [Burkholderiaceae bacterium]|nr:peptide chain release factor N(5)-glutamine methyltransferase [Burkholderiaceae bacterium]